MIFCNIKNVFNPMRRQAWVRILCMEAFHIQDDHAMEALNAAAKSLGSIKEKLDESCESNKGGKFMSEPIAEATLSSKNGLKKIKQLEKAFLFLPAHTAHTLPGILKCWSSNVGAQMLVLKCW